MKSFICFVALSCLSVIAIAQTQTDQGSRQQELMAELEKRFTAADTNKDGCLSKQEAQSKMPRVYKQFDTIDKAGKGCITLAQIKSAINEQASKRKS